MSKNRGTKDSTQQLLGGVVGYYHDSVIVNFQVLTAECRKPAQCCAPRRCSGRRQGRRLNYAFFSMAPVHWLRCIGKGLDSVLNLIAVLNHAGPSLLPLVQLQQRAVVECVAVQRQLVTR